MMRVKLTSRGDFTKTETFMRRAAKKAVYANLEKYGEIGVRALSDATPVDTGKTAASWSYSISKAPGSISITWSNSNKDRRGVPIVVLIRYGHGLRGGGYVAGRDFISPAIRPVFDEIADSIWNEVTRE